MKIFGNKGYLPIDRFLLAEFPLPYLDLPSRGNLWMPSKVSRRSHGFYLRSPSEILLETETVDTFGAEDACELAQLRHLISSHNPSHAG